MDLNYIGSIPGLPANPSLQPISDGTFGRFVNQSQREVIRLFNGLPFSWGNFSYPSWNGWISPYESFNPPGGLIQGGGMVRGGMRFFGASDYAYWNTQGVGQIGAGLIGNFGYIGQQIRAEYRRTAQGPGGSAAHTAYNNGTLYSTAVGRMVTPPEYPSPTNQGGINPVALCDNTTVTFIGFISTVYALVAIDMKCTTFPTATGHDILGNPLYPVGSFSSQYQQGQYALFNMTNGNYEPIGQMLQMNYQQQLSKNNGDGTASNGDMVYDATQNFLAPTIGGQYVNISAVMDLDGNFRAQDDRGYVSVALGTQTPTLQWALGFAQAQGGADLKINSGWSHDLFPGGAFPMGTGLYADWAQISPGSDYSVYEMQAYNGAPANFTTPYAMVNGTRETLTLKRYARPGVKLNYPLPFNALRGVIYYRGLPGYVIQDTVSAAGNTTYDVYIPTKLRYAVAFNGMRNFTRPISPTLGDKL
jgi:hypothetical protein